MKKILLQIIFAIIVYATTQSLFAVPARSNLIAYKLPDGTEIMVNLQGDEWTSWAVTPDGYTLLFNGEGYLEYAVKDPSGNLVLSGIRAKNSDQRTVAESDFLSNLPKGLEYSSSQRDAMGQLRAARWKAMQKNVEEEKSNRRQKVSPISEAPIDAPVLGNRRFPLILVDFPDRPFTKTKIDFEMLMNQLNYTAGGITGSVRDYYLANSYGQLDLQADVYGPYRMSKNIVYYDHKSGGKPNEMADEAARAAVADGCDFSVYAKSGSVDVIHIIFAGYSQAIGAIKGQSMWPHAWEISPAGGITLNGVVVNRYSCSEELKGTSGATLATIGTICHELGHSLCGLPDFYDTDNTSSGGSSVDLGEWDIMANGVYNNGGNTPACFSAYGRDFCGWAPAVTLSSAASITLPNPVSFETKAIYRINTATPNEYFLVENRQQVGWDEFIPASGMLIYHVNKNNLGWNSQCINCFPNNRGYYVKQAGCADPLSNCTDRTADPFPQPGNTSFTDTTIPNAMSWAGQNTEKPITDIVHNTSTRTISFKFMGGLSAPVITTATLPGAVRDTMYHQTLMAMGEQPITWQLESGSLPVGLTLSSDGEISGVPTKMGVSNFRVNAVNATGSVSQALSIVVHAEPHHYQWYSNTVNSTAGGTPIPGAVHPFYIPSGADVGTLYYYCEITNSCGTAVSKISGGHTVN